MILKFETIIDKRKVDTNAIDFQDYLKKVAADKIIEGITNFIKIEESEIKRENENEVRYIAEINIIPHQLLPHIFQMLETIKAFNPSTTNLVETIKKELTE